jgi:hypothetical protein
MARSLLKYNQRNNVSKFEFNFERNLSKVCEKSGNYDLIFEFIAGNM